VANIVILYCDGDEDRARWLDETWTGGRVTLCQMGPQRRRLALGARSVLVGLWSSRAVSEEAGRQMGDVLARSEGRAILVVWDGRPPLATVTAAGVPVLVAPPEPDALIQRLQAAAAELVDGKPLEASPPRHAVGGRTEVDDKRARIWGIVVGAVLAALLVIAGLVPLAARFIGP
jgi:hypothetical protein